MCILESIYYKMFSIWLDQIFFTVIFPSPVPFAILPSHSQQIEPFFSIIPL